MSTLNILESMIKPYMRKLFASVSTDLDDVRTALKIIKQDRTKIENLAQKLGVRVDLVDNGLQGLHELFIVFAHNAQQPKKNLTNFVNK